MNSAKQIPGSSPGRDVIPHQKLQWREKSCKCLENHFISWIVTYEHMR